MARAKKTSEPSTEPKPPRKPRAKKATSEPVPKTSKGRGKAAKEPAEKTSSKREKTLVKDRADFILSSARGEGWAAQYKQIEKTACRSDAVEWLRAHVEETLWAREFLSSDPWLYPLLDTETTKRGADAEITDISVMLHDETVLVDTLVKPASAITARSSEITGLRAADVADAPTFAEIVPQLAKAFARARGFVAYNGDFDHGILEQSVYFADADLVVPAPIKPDIMERFARWVGDWDSRFNHYKWHKLEGGHRAAGDVRVMLDMIRKMAASTAPEQAEIPD